MKELIKKYEISELYTELKENINTDSLEDLLKIKLMTYYSNSEKLNDTIKQKYPENYLESNLDYLYNKCTQIESLKNIIKPTKGCVLNKLQYRIKKAYKPIKNQYSEDHTEIINLLNETKSFVNYEIKTILDEKDPKLFSEIQLINDKYFSSNYKRIKYNKLEEKRIKSLNKFKGLALITTSALASGVVYSFMQGNFNNMLIYSVASVLIPSSIIASSPHKKSINNVPKIIEKSSNFDCNIIDLNNKIDESLNKYIDQNSGTDEENKLLINNTHKYIFEFIGY